MDWMGYVELDDWAPFLGKRLYKYMQEMDQVSRRLLWEHIRGGTSSRWIAETLTEHGYPVGKSTINDVRRRLRDE